MVQAIKEEERSYAQAFEALERTLAHVEPGWLQELRRRAMATFQQQGFPTAKEEAWRFTDIRGVTERSFYPGEPPKDPDVEAVSQEPFFGLAARRLTFVNGHYNEQLSQVAELPTGVEVGSLALLIEKDPDRARKYLAGQVSAESGAFPALNLALMGDGAFVYVPKGTIVETPVEVVFLSSSSETPQMAHSRNLIVVEENAQLSLVETHLGRRSEAAFNNLVTEIYAAGGAVVDHYKLQHESSGSYHFGTVSSRQQRSSSVRTSVFSLNGSLIRNEVIALLDGEGGWAELDGLFLVNRDHHVDNFTEITHAKPHCDSREIYRGILDDSGRGVFRGRIVVAKDAQKTDSKQTNNNLLLSDNALINTKPQLEIYADDVKCTHGATIGQLSRDAVFYLRSRGLDESAARSILIYAFANEIVRRIKIGPLRDALDGFLFDRLPKGTIVREAV